ncbi:MAG: T9SS type A sorting domain-containing protein, partial [Chitinophagaceae bacterium]|nr:T9SS type A sorting domain-containing protein [Chitinophagaceae bacterium]
PGIRAGTGNGIYHQFIEGLDEGITYLRARILLKNGASVYTETLQVISSGFKPLLFYPNPANTTTSLKFILRSASAREGQILFFDITGRLLMKLPARAGSVNISAFPGGVVIYRLADVKGKVLHTGKILVIRGKQ